MKKIDYNQRLHADYHKGRALDESVLRLWGETARRAIGDRCGLTILDLGCGTGRFSALLADEFDAQVIGVEPSDKMRAVAETRCVHPRVRFVAGAAESIPLDDNSCDVVWMSQVIHHLPDLDVAAQEFRRVIKDTGVVLIRNNFKGRLEGICRYYDFFPSAIAADEARHPTVEYVAECFERHGFRRTAFESVKQMEARSLQDYFEMIRLRTYSTFELISEDEFQSGLAALEAAAIQEQHPQPVMGIVDLLVLQCDGRNRDDGL